MAESLSIFNNVTRQIAWEDILNNQRRESFKSYIRHLQVLASTKIKKFSKIFIIQPYILMTHA